MNEQAAKEWNDFCVWKRVRKRKKYTQQLVSFMLSSNQAKFLNKTKQSCTAIELLKSSKKNSGFANFSRSTWTIIDTEITAQGPLEEEVIWGGSLWCQNISWKNEQFNCQLVVLFLWHQTAELFPNISVFVIM